MLFHKDEVSTQIGVKGMMCQHCVMHVSESLKKIKGVQAVDVSLKDGTASIKSSRPLSDEELNSAILEAGYEYTGKR